MTDTAAEHDTFFSEFVDGVDGADNDNEQLKNLMRVKLKLSAHGIKNYSLAFKAMQPCQRMVVFDDAGNRRSALSVAQDSLGCYLTVPAGRADVHLVLDAELFDYDFLHLRNSDFGPAGFSLMPSRNKEIVWMDGPDLARLSAGSSVVIHLERRINGRTRDKGWMHDVFFHKHDPGCVPAEDSEAWTYFATSLPYSRSSCLLHKYLTSVISECGCTPPTLEASGIVSVRARELVLPPICHGTGLTCARRLLRRGATHACRPACGEADEDFRVLRVEAVPIPGQPEFLSHPWGCLVAKKIHAVCNATAENHDYCARLDELEQTDAGDVCTSQLAHDYAVRHLVFLRLVVSTLAEKPTPPTWSPWSWLLLLPVLLGLNLLTLPEMLVQGLLACCGERKNSESRVQRLDSSEHES